MQKQGQDEQSLVDGRQTYPDLVDTVGSIKDIYRQDRLQHFSSRASLSFPSCANIFPCHTSIVASEWNLSKLQIRTSEVSFRMYSCDNRLDLSFFVLHYLHQGF